MKEKPIIFDAESVRAILEGRKTQTRRVLRLYNSCGVRTIEGNRYGRWFTNRGGSGFKCPYGQPSNRLWVRETWAVAPLAIHYKADNVFKSYPDEPRLYDCVSTRGWRSPIFMPRWACRITLEITGIRIEQVRSISEKDALSEGFDEGWYGGGLSGKYRHAMQWYQDRWNTLNAKRGFPWESNPWVWVIEFELARQSL